MLTIVLPVYNESESILECLERLSRSIETYEHEILVCYDFDEDTTLPILEKVRDKYPALRLVKNVYGRGAAKAIKSGIEDARGNIIITTMADLSDPPEIIPSMIQQIEKGAWVVSASRYIPGGSIKGAPFLKEKLSMLAGLTLNLFTGIRTRDVTNNFRAYKRELFDRIEIESLHGFEIGLELTAKAFRAGLPIGEVPSQWEERMHGETKFKLWQWLPFYLNWYFYALIPFLIFMTTGFALFSINFFNADVPILFELMSIFSIIGFMIFRRRGLQDKDSLFLIMIYNPLYILLEQELEHIGITLAVFMFLILFVREFGLRKAIAFDP